MFHFKGSLFNTPIRPKMVLQNGGAHFLSNANFGQNLREQFSAWEYHSLAPQKCDSDQKLWSYRGKSVSEFLALIILPRRYDKYVKDILIILTLIQNKFLSQIMKNFILKQSHRNRKCFSQILNFLCQIIG